MQKSKFYSLSVIACAALLAACAKDKAPAAPTAEQIAKNDADLITYLDA